jgi:hypothetical protein
MKPARFDMKLLRAGLPKKLPEKLPHRLKTTGDGRRTISLPAVIRRDCSPGR